MTDLTPNDLSHMSDEEFMALCPQGEHAPGPEPLSPAAEAVLDAFRTSRTGQRCLAAALRVVAAHLPNSTMYPSSDWGHGWRNGINDARQRLLAIAAELEGSNA